MSRWLYDCQVGRVRVTNLFSITIFFKCVFHFLEQQTLAAVRHPYLFALECYLAQEKSVVPSCNYDLDVDVNGIYSDTHMT